MQPPEQINNTVRDHLIVTGTSTDFTNQVDRVAWFQTAIEGSDGPLTDEELQLLTQRYGRAFP